MSQAIIENVLAKQTNKKGALIIKAVQDLGISVIYLSVHHQSHQTPGQEPPLSLT